MTFARISLQTQADLISIPVDRPSMRETTSLGAAIAAGFAFDVWKDFSELKDVNREGRTIFKPQISKEEGAKMFRLWEKAVKMCQGWVADEEKESRGEK